MSEKYSEYRKQNREVPFPNEELIIDKELENYFTILDEAETFMDYENLPETITSGRIDAYANWLSQLTRNDPQHRERGSFIFLNTKNEWIFPQNPSIGTSQKVAPISTFSPHKNFPLIRAHSHPDASAFSTIDLKRSLTNRGHWGEKNDAIAELVATQKGNYLLLRTQQSEFFPQKDVDEVSEMISDIISNASLMRWQQQINRFKSFGKSDAESIQLTEMVTKKEKEILGSDLARLNLTINMTEMLTIKSKLGFYFSEGNGVFSKHNSERTLRLKSVADGIFQQIFHDNI